MAPVDPAELFFLVALAAVLVGLAGYFGWRQVQTLRGLAGQPAEDRSYLRRQAVRRLVCCTLMVVLAGLLLGNIFLEPHLQEMSRQLAQQQGEASQENKEFARFFGVYQGAALIVLFALLLLAAVDFWAIARFGMRHRRQLQADHRASLHEEIARLRRRHNGDGA